MAISNYETVISQIVEMKENKGMGSRAIAKELGISKSSVNYYYERFMEENNIVDDIKTGPRVLVLDIETAPIMAHVWRLFKTNVGLNMIESDWYMLSFAAKWFDSDEIIYMDQRNAPNIEDDSEMLKVLWELLDEADIVLHQNGRRFDIPKIRSRMIVHGMKPFSTVKHIDTLEIAKRTFGFTSNKLEYMTDKLCTETKKSKHTQFPGFELWKECLAGNIEAWKEMEEYNIDDIVSLQELYVKLAPWSDRLPNFSLYTDSDKFTCVCGNHEFEDAGFAYTEVSKFKQYKCTHCGKHWRGRKNQITKIKSKLLLTNARE
ncbi:hypothetical protein [Aeromonas phage AS-yj]|uniref:YprB ribonuclease H-like domain-containing protein n=5 Tax=Ceceduovirus TaxID=2842588 RepID=A0A291LEQ3_9CAUD|nr:DNA polymerase exonuclease subunit [Aeromonas phage AS-zj]YP_009834991.1 DNA polymerase exonuclease subunit [Aeromonas phage AS-sw]ATI17505.1 hypothetical protein [Aeromonas phage AS-szw]ATI18006.1 hypothetical protein [Aeromonas phage AS-yj]QAX97944.1 hypothetical protein ASswx1_302 [Aeromonas phage Asswx_1]QAX99007.1 hypothetical protein assk_216 [Aeromonas phage Assk]QMV28954.1 hypothetical protein AP1_0247 [Aeromonas phage AP1]UKM62573.1 putative RNase H superfamily protein [Aeromonas